MSSILKVDQIQLSNGNTPTANDLGLNVTGNVLQVVSARSNANVSTTSTTFSSAGLSVNITPKSATSKILVIVNGGSWYTNSDHAYATILRGSTNLGDTGQYNTGLARKNGNLSYSPHAMSVYDTPNTTNQITYSAHFRSNVTSSATYFSYESYGYVTMTAIEIAG